MIPVLQKEVKQLLATLAAERDEKARESLAVSNIGDCLQFCMVSTRSKVTAAKIVAAHLAGESEVEAALRAGQEQDDVTVQTLKTTLNGVRRSALLAQREKQLEEKREAAGPGSRRAAGDQAHTG